MNNKLFIGTLLITSLHNMQSMDNNSNSFLDHAAPQEEYDPFALIRIEGNECRLRALDGLPKVEKELQEEIDVANDLHQRIIALKNGADTLEAAATIFELEIAVTQSGERLSQMQGCIALLQSAINTEQKTE